MVSHEQIWAAIDALAALHGLSASGLAQRAGLNATAFNRSKRISSDGRARWPSTESIAKILTATSTSLADLVGLISADEAQGYEVKAAVRPTSIILQPLPGLAPSSGFAEEGRDVSEGPILFPGWGDVPVYHITLQSNGFEPVYRRGDRLIVSPVTKASTGDRLLLISANGLIDLVEVSRWGRNPLATRIGSGEKLEPDRAGLLFMARILWASQ